MSQHPLRVGEEIICDTEEVTLIRKELPCDRWLARTSDGEYVQVFTCDRTKHFWVTTTLETDRLNGDIEGGDPLDGDVPT